MSVTSPDSSPKKYGSKAKQELMRKALPIILPLTIAIGICKYSEIGTSVSKTIKHMGREAGRQATGYVENIGDSIHDAIIKDPVVGPKLKRYEEMKYGNKEADPTEPLLITWPVINPEAKTLEIKSFLFAPGVTTIEEIADAFEGKPEKIGKNQLRDPNNEYTIPTDDFVILTENGKDRDGKSDTDDPECYDIIFNVVPGSNLIQQIYYPEDELSIGAPFSVFDENTGEFTGDGPYAIETFGLE